MNKQEISKLVNSLYQHHGTYSPYLIAEQLGVSIHYIDYSKAIGRMTYSTNSIHLNKNLDTPILEYVLAHELGHYLLHSTYNHKTATQEQLDNMEQEADCFALKLVSAQHQTTAEQLIKKLQQICSRYITIANILEMRTVNAL